MAAGDKVKHLLGLVLFFTLGAARASAVQAIPSSRDQEKILQSLFSDDFQTRESGIEEATRLKGGEQQALVAKLVEALAGSNHKRRNHAFYALERLDLAGVPGLESALKAGDPDVRLTAAPILGRIGKRNPSAISNDIALALAARAVKDRDSRVRFAAVVALSDLGRPAATAAPALREALLDSDRHVRLNAAGALAGMGQGDGSTVALLAASLADPDPYTRQAAANSLGLMGTKARDVVPPLIKALHDPNEIVRLYAADSLASIDPKEKSGVDVLAALVASSTPGVRSGAAHTIERLGPTAASAAPALGEALATDDLNLRTSAVIALGAIGPAARAQVPALVKLLAHSDIFLAAQIVKTLSKINTPEALKAIQEHEQKPAR